MEQKKLWTKASFLHVLMRFLKSELDIYINFPLDSKMNQKQF